MGFAEIDLGLPVLTTLWPLMVILGLGLMAPIVVWAIRTAASENSRVRR
jgi:hypothetical protein